MPGILPMKVIKVAGTTTQTRIAQACDRCRSKKIRCDGLAPTCSQCSNVGFECKTSDKLSRRAFPRGYTESLEDRVRALEMEVKELKDLLDEKDEKIDMLSKMHSQTPTSPRRPSSVTTTGVSEGRRASLRQEKDDVVKLIHSPFLLGDKDSDGYFMGTSSGRALVDAFKRKVQETGKACSDLDPASFFPAPAKQSPSPALNGNKLWKTPPRLLSDQMVNVYFQEWAPLFPILHRPTFLSLYQRYVADPSTVTDMRSLAQLHLVFGIATLSKEAQVSQGATFCEKQWTSAMQSFTMENSIPNLQCLVLAQVYCMQTGSQTKLLHYKGQAIGVAQRLGLHLSQKAFALGALTIETRKKVFWSMYTLDCFSAAFLGLPKLLNEGDIHCEYPIDADDEYVTEQGFQPTLPGEFTKISSALALFRGSRVLSKVLEQNYTAAASQELSLRDVASLDQELEDWSSSLAPHLKMVFLQDKPSTQVVSSRCPLLSLTYHYIRALIHRPAVCANSEDKASSSVVTLASSSKHTIQLLQLLDERNLSFSHCINKNELLFAAGFGILFQVLEVEQDSKLMKDNAKTINTVAELLERRSAPGAFEFRRFGCSMFSGLSPSAVPSMNQPHARRDSRSKADAQIVHEQTKTDAQKQLLALAARYTLATTIGSVNDLVPKEKRWPTNPSSSHTRELTRSDVTGPQTVVPTHNRPHASSFSHRTPSFTGRPSVSHTPKHVPHQVYHGHRMNSVPDFNLDYLSLSTNGAAASQLYKTEFNPESTWESLLDSLDESRVIRPLYDESNAQPDMYQFGPLTANTAESTSSWSPDTWDFGLEPCKGNGVAQQPTQSVLSFTDESLTSGEDFSSIGAGSMESDKAFGHMMIPHNYSPEGLSPDMNHDFDALQGLVGS